MMKRIVRGTILLLPIAAMLSGAAAERRCNIPVFRYALERWPADPYGVTVLHRGTLGEEDQATLALLEKYADGLANISVATTDAEKDAADLPKFIVKYPDAHPEDPLVWSGPLTRENVEKVIDSPVRATIAKKILSGDSAVWVFLEVGDKAKDDAAAEVLEEQLKVMEKSLKLPELTDDPEDRLNFTEAIPLKLAFPMVRLSRTDPAEEVLVNMLLRTEDDLTDLKEPMVFPAFGRGRILPALVGKGITKSNIEEYCAFIAGPCSCQVKALNPGLDLLVKSEWVDPYGKIEERPALELPPVILKPAEEEKPDTKIVEPVPIPPPPPTPKPAPKPAPAPQKKGSADSSARTLLWVGVFVAGTLALITGIRALILSRKGAC